MDIIDAIETPKTFHDVAARLQDFEGRAYKNIRDQLAPRYLVAWAQIGAAHIALWSVVTIVVTADPGTPVFVAAIGIAGALIVGYATAFLALWFHEATHFNLHPNKTGNDWLANLLIGPLILQDVAQYRVVHLAHHSRHGTVSDTEHSYFQPVCTRFLLRALFGLSAFEIMRFRFKLLRPVERVSAFTWPLLVGLVAHLTMITIALELGLYALAIAWGCGIGMIYPLLGTLRQVLEHRRPDADSATNYFRSDHGPFTRVFGAGPFASTFGGAGFNRHLIHHWDPSLSCTRFGEMEDFLKQTEIGDFYRSRNTSYWTALRESAS